jgi:integrase
MAGIYRKSPQYQELSKRMQSNYEYGLGIAASHPLKNDPHGRTRVGQLSLAEVTPGLADKLYAKVKVDREPLVDADGAHVVRRDGNIAMREIPRLRRGQEVMKACRRAWNVARRHEPTMVPHTNPFERAEIETPRGGKTVPATWEQTMTFVKACDEAGNWSIGTAALVSFCWFQREEHIMGVPREDGRTTGLLWTDYRPKNDPGCVVIQHPKTNEAVRLPLYSVDGRALHPELMERLDNAAKRGALVCMRDKPDATGVYRPWPTRGDHAALATFIRRVATIRDKAALPKEITFRSFRHGAFTAGGDADLSDADLNAVGAKTDATIDLYRKGTMEQRQRALTKLLDQRSNQQRLSTK